MAEYCPPLSSILSVDRRALISCNRCRRLKKKCKQEGRARCQRCIETDQVCRYSDLAEEVPGQERGVSLSPPPSPTTKLIFPTVDFPDSPPHAHSPSPPPARGLQQMDNGISLNKVQSFAGPSSIPSQQPPSFQPAQSISPVLDPRMTSSSISPSQYDNNATTPYASYPQQPSYNPPFPQSYGTDPYDAPFESAPGYMIPSPSSPSEKYHVQDSPSPTYDYPYGGSQLTEPYSPQAWSDSHNSMPTGTMASNPYSPSRAQSFKQTNAVASTSSLATPGYNDYTFYDTGAGISGSTKGCQGCYAGYCSFHEGFIDDMMHE